MRPLSWITGCFHVSQPRRVRRRRLFDLQSLEDRLAPAVRTWTGLGADDLWSNAANWDTGAPADGDDVRIAATAESAEVLFDTSVAGTGVTISSLTSDGTNPITEPFRITGGTLTLSGAGVFAFGADLTINGGTLNVGSAAADAVNAANFTLNNGLLGGPGTLTVAGLLTWNGGNMIDSGTTLSGRTLANGGLALTGSGAMAGRRLDNAGLATWTGTGDLTLQEGAVFNNNGTFDIQNNRTIFLGGGTSAFNNNGTVRKSAGTGVSTIGITFNNNNAGSVDVQTGALRFDNGGTSTGSWTVSAPAVLVFGFGTHNLNAGSTVNGAGTARFIGTTNLADTYSVSHTEVAGIVSFNADSSTTTLFLDGSILAGSGNLTVAGLLTWNGGNMSGSGTTFANGGLALTGSGAMAGRRLDNAGLATWTGTGDLTLQEGAVFNNNGTFDIQNNRTIYNGSAPAAFNNNGTVKKSAGGGPSTIGIDFTNNGTIDVQTGTLSITGPLTNYSGATHTLTGGTYAITGSMLLFNSPINTNAAAIVLNGPSSGIGTNGGDAFSTFTTNADTGNFTIQNGRNFTSAAAFNNAGNVGVGAGSTFTLGGGGNYTQSAGTTTLNGTLSANTVGIQGGLLQGAGTVNGDVTNAAQVSPGGSPGALTIDGSYTQTNAGSLSVEIGGPNPGSQFDQLVVTGQATLDGTVNVTRLGGFVPAGLDAFRIVNAGSRTGAFATLTGSSFPGGQFTLRNDATGALLDANVAPTPADDSDTTVKGHAVTTNVIANDSDPDGDALSVVAVEVSTQGVTPVNNGDGTITYNPPVDFEGTDSYTYTVRDSLGNEATATVTISVTPVNDPPTLDAIPDPPAILEDAGVQSMNLTGISAGSGEIQSLTVTATSSNPGLIPNPTVTYSSPDDVGSLHYTPVPNGSGTAVITVTVKDDGGTAFGGVDEITRTFTVTVNPVPDAPTIDTEFIPLLPALPLTPAPTNPAGAPVSDLLHGVTEVDSDPLGIAFTGIDNRSGTWQFSLNGGASWSPVPTNVSATAALVLSADADSRVRFVPKKLFQGFASLTFKAWDQSDGAIEGTQVDSTLAPTGYSNSTERAWIAVGKTTPVVNANGATVLAAVREDSKSSRTFLVKSLLGIAGLEQAPATNLGFAVTGLDSTSGRWQFRLAGTTSFVDVGAASNANALLLRPIDIVRFIPNANADGGSSLTFKTWNQVGTAGTKVDSSGAGFGKDPGSAVLDIIAVNDAPVLDLSVAAALNPVNAGETTNEPTFASLMSATDVDGPATGVAVVAAKGSGWEFNAGGGWTPLGVVSSLKALLLNTDAQLRFVAPAGATPGTATLSFKAWDQLAGSGVVGTRVPLHGSAFSKQSEIATVAIGNQAPVLNTAPDVKLPNVVSSSTRPIVGTLVKTLLGTSVTDTPGSLRGIAVVFADNTHGKWQYAISASAFIDIGSVTTNSALLLTDVSKLRFVPNAGFTGQATIQFKAWDRTTGQTGDRIDTGPPLNSFSLEAETATVNVL